MRISMYSRGIEQHLSSSRSRKANEQERQANNKSKHALNNTRYTWRKGGAECLNMGFQGRHHVRSASGRDPWEARLRAHASVVYIVYCRCALNSLLDCHLNSATGLRFPIVNAPLSRNPASAPSLEAST